MDAPKRHWRRCVRAGTVMLNTVRWLPLAILNQQTVFRAPQGAGRHRWDKAGRRGRSS